MRNEIPFFCYAERWLGGCRTHIVTYIDSLAIKYLKFMFPLPAETTL